MPTVIMMYSQPTRAGLCDCESHSFSLSVRHLFIQLKLSKKWGLLHLSLSQKANNHQPMPAVPLPALVLTLPRSHCEVLVFLSGTKPLTPSPF